MNKEELAAKLDGSEYPLFISMDLHEEAKESGLVIAYGESDDLMEFLGAIDYEIGICSGDRVLVSKNGVVPSWESISKNDPKEDYCRKYFLNKNQSKPIKAIWGVGEYSWSYKTEIPHACFDIMDDGEKYCRGIVFHVDDIYRPVMNEHQKVAIEALENMRGNDLQGARRTFGICTEEMMNQEYHHSGKTRLEILNDYEARDEGIKAAIGWVKRQPGE